MKEKASKHLLRYTRRPILLNIQYFSFCVCIVYFPKLSLEKGIESEKCHIFSNNSILSMERPNSTEKNQPLPTTLTLPELQRRQTLGPRLPQTQILVRSQSQTKIVTQMRNDH